MVVQSVTRPSAVSDVRRGSTGLAAYFWLAFGITWVLVAPIAASRQGWISADVSGEWHAVGALGPLVAALIVSRRRAGDLERLTAGLARWRVSPWFYLAALSPALFLLPAAVATRWVDGQWPTLGGLADSPRLADGAWVLALLMPAVAYSIGEEVGWRGFALPRLQARFRPLPAALVLGVVWVAWHLPFYFYRQGMVDSTLGEQIAQAVVIIIGGLFLAWLYNSTGGSILLCAIWHFTHSVVHIAIPEVSQTWDTYSGVFGTVLAIAVTAIWWRRMSVHDTQVYGAQARVAALEGGAMRRSS